MGIVSGGGGGSSFSPSFARVQKTAIVNNWDGSTILFNSVTVDAAGLWDAVNHQFVAKRAGWYEFQAYATGTGGGISPDTAANTGTRSIQVVVFGVGDNIWNVVSEHTIVVDGKWFFPSLVGHTQLAIADAAVIQGDGGAGWTVPAGFTFSIFGPLG